MSGLEHDIGELLGLADVHLDMIDELIPFFGNTREEVIKHILVFWLKTNKLVG